jgi:hypothetical protein
MLDENTKYPVLAIYYTVSFNLKNGAETQASLRISPLNVAKYLDINDLKTKTKTPHDYVNDAINFMTSSEVRNTGPIKIISNPTKNMQTSVGQNHYPAWRLEYTTTAFGKTGFSIAIFTVDGDRAFKFVMDTEDPLQLPTYLPIFQKMIDSFQITG